MWLFQVNIITYVDVVLILGVGFEDCQQIPCFDLLTGLLLLMAKCFQVVSDHLVRLVHNEQEVAHGAESVDFLGFSQDLKNWRVAFESGGGAAIDRKRVEELELDNKEF